MPDGADLRGAPDLTPHRAALETWLRSQTGQPNLRLGDIALLPGGAVQRNWRLELHVDQKTTLVVLRAGPDVPLPESRSKMHEYSLLQKCWENGVPVAEPIWLEPSGAVIGQAFMVSSCCPGDADRSGLLANPARDAILDQLAAALAEIHGLPVPDSLEPETPSARVAALCGWVRDLGHVPPGVVAGLDWLNRKAPNLESTGIVHRDFRTGNFLVDGKTLSAILDWEFAGAGDVHEDIGWFCARCWRGENVANEAGGLGARNAFYRAYISAGGRPPDRERVHFWEIFAHVRWALIAMQQAQRAAVGEYPVWELEEAGNRVPGLSELILMMLDGA